MKGQKNVCVFKNESLFDPLPMYTQYYKREENTDIS